MKVFTRKERSSLSLMPAATGSANSPLSVGNLDESFHGWLRAVTTAPPNSADKAALVHEFTAVSAEDFVRVNRATVRESDSHRFWPSYVIEKFLGADVVDSSTISHYVVRDSNLTRKVL
jgi:hypothetical protein